MGGIDPGGTPIICLALLLGRLPWLWCLLSKSVLLAGWLILNYRSCTAELWLLLLHLDCLQA
jgi:hypothetical protein